RSQPLHSTLKSCCGNGAEAAVMKSRLIWRSTRTTVGLSQSLLGWNFTVIPRCGQTHRTGASRISKRRIRVRYRIFALGRPFLRKTHQSWRAARLRAGIAPIGRYRARTRLSDLERVGIIRVCFSPLARHHEYGSVPSPLDEGITVRCEQSVSNSVPNTGKQQLPSELNRRRINETDDLHPVNRVAGTALSPRLVRVIDATGYSLAAGGRDRRRGRAIALRRQCGCGRLPVG